MRRSLAYRVSDGKRIAPFAAVATRLASRPDIQPLRGYTQRRGRNYAARRILFAVLRLDGKLACYALRTILTPETVRLFVENAMPMRVIGLPEERNRSVYDLSCICSMAFFAVESRFTSMM